ncbi:MAG TPA: cysteine desulfurase [Euryarchaeota archaeon]|nr:cysteine desulfurase [Euryarchaeota archaeon]
MIPERIRNDFPVLERRFDGKPIIYFDSACQTLRPKSVIDAITRYYNEFPACAGRSVHKLATQVSLEIDTARGRIAEFVNAKSADQICFFKNCTEAMNTVLFGIGLKKGDTVVATDREHNSMHVPLLMLKDTVGIEYDYVQSRKDETFDLDRFTDMMNKKVRLVAMCHTSNVNGTTIPAKEICDIAHENGCIVLLDGAQYMPYGVADLEKIGADLYAFSSHKMCGPSGLGVLYGKTGILEEIKPLIYGGHAIVRSDRDKAELISPPERFEAGLQNYSGIIGAGAATTYLSDIGRENIVSHVSSLNKLATDGLSEIKEVSILEPVEPSERGGILSFNIDGYRAHDVAMIADHRENVMIRSGMHCVHSWFNDRGIEGSARASFYIYNTKEEVEVFIDMIRKIASSNVTKQ